MWLGPAAANQTLKAVYILHEISSFYVFFIRWNQTKNQPFVCILDKSEGIVGKIVCPLNNTAYQHNVKSAPAPATDVLSTLSAPPRGLWLWPSSSF